jgi:hypothetical protein
MFQSNTAELINQVVQNILRGGQVIDSSKKVLFITVCLEVCKSKNDEHPLRRYAHLMYHVGGNYVLVGSQSSSNSMIPSHHEWQYQSYHDSCWRDGTKRVLSENYFSMCKQVAPDLAPIKLIAAATIQQFMFRPVSLVEHGGKDNTIRLEF